MSNPLLAWESVGFRGVWETSQEVGCRNHPPCLRNRLLPKLVHSTLGVLGVMDTVPAEFQDVNARGGRILESRIDLEGGAEVTLLLVYPLLTRILCSSLSHGVLRSVEITQESRPGGGMESCHEIFDWG